MKVMIVDDEIRVRQGLKRNIEELEGDFVVSDIFSNGKEALEAVRNSKPDILITDIKMPVMDGLELAKEVRTIAPFIKIIILSGYCEFEYAKLSMQYGVSDFLVKPINREELFGTLAKIRNEIQQYKQESSNQKYQEELLRKYQNEILCAYMNEFTPKLLQEKSHFFSDIMKCYLVVLIESTEQLFEDTRIEIEQHFLKVKIHELADRCLCLLIECEQEDTSQTICDWLGQTLSRKEGMPLKIGASSLKKRGEELQEACKEAVKTFKMHFYLEKNQAVLCSEHEFSVVEEFSKSSQRELITAIFSGEKENINAVIGKLEEETKSRKLDILSLKHCMIHLIRALDSEMIKLGMNSSAHKFEVFKDVLMIKDLSEIFKELETHIHYIYGEIMVLANNQNNAKINAVINYINEHLDQNIALTDVCILSGMSSAYLSRTFKEKTGINFVDYVNRQKIEKAKDYLIYGKKTELEIAEMLCFNDDKYFIRLFKKIVGMTPGAYRKVAVSMKDKNVHF